MVELLSRVSVEIQDLTLSMLDKKMTVELATRTNGTDGYHDSWDFDAEIRSIGPGFSITFDDLPTERHKAGRALLRALLELEACKDLMKYLLKEKKRLPSGATLSVDVCDLSMSFIIDVERPDPTFTFVGLEEDEAE